MIQQTFSLLTGLIVMDNKTKLSNNTIKITLRGIYFTYTIIL